MLKMQKKEGSGVVAPYEGYIPATYRRLALDIAVICFVALCVALIGYFAKIK